MSRSSPKGAEISPAMMSPTSQLRTSNFLLRLHLSQIPLGARHVFWPWRFPQLVRQCPRGATPRSDHRAVGGAGGARETRGYVLTAGGVSSAPSIWSVMFAPVRTTVLDPSPRGPTSL